MSYKIEIGKSVIKELLEIDKKEVIKIKEEVSLLTENPRPVGSKKLINRDGWRIRIGNYQVIYELDDEIKIVRILHIGHRKDIYRMN
jgi:mRNA interferase RelE/StbE